MVEAIYDLKNQLLEKMEQDISERGIERLDKDQVDMIKDLAEAEKSCWEAEYYRSVTEAMEGQSGYPNNQGGYVRGNSGYTNGRSGRSGGTNGRSGYMMRRGYGMSGYPVEDLKMQLQHADPQERERIMQELRQMMNGQM